MAARAPRIRRARRLPDRFTWGPHVSGDVPGAEAWRAGRPARAAATFAKPEGAAKTPPPPHLLPASPDVAHAPVRHAGPSDRPSHERSLRPHMWGRAGGQLRRAVRGRSSTIERWLLSTQTLTRMPVGSGLSSGG